LEQRKESTAQEKPVALSDGGQLPKETPRSLPEADPMAEDWASKNKWFGRDRPMTFTAFEIHKDLVEKEGYDPKSDEYYAEIDKRIKVDFPHKFAIGGSTETPKTQSVGSFCKQKRKTRAQNCETHFLTGAHCKKIRSATRRVCKTIKTHGRSISI
jgi:hypothetical protein